MQSQPCTHTLTCTAKQARTLTNSHARGGCSVCWNKCLAPLTCKTLMAEWKALIALRCCLQRARVASRRFNVSLNPVLCRSRPGATHPHFTTVILARAKESGTASTVGCGAALRGGATGWSGTAAIITAPLSSLTQRDSQVGEGASSHWYLMHAWRQEECRWMETKGLATPLLRTPVRGASDS